MSALAFALKKALSWLLRPTMTALWLLIAGLVLRRRPGPRRKRTGRWLVALGCGLLLAASNPGLSGWLLRGLERQLPAFDVEAHRGEDIRRIAVLGGGHNGMPNRPITGRISPTSAARVAEAVRIARHFPQASVHFTGWGADKPTSTAEDNAAVAVALGLPATRVAIHPGPRDTRDELALLARVAPDERWVLVTNASHAPRATLLARRNGVDVIAAPTAYRGPRHLRWWRMPSATALTQTEAWWHETLGMAWVRLRALLDG